MMDKIPDQDDWNQKKLQLICELVKNMSQEFKNEVIKQLVGEPVGEAQVSVSSNEQFVRIDFGRPLAWFAVPKAHAMLLGKSLMEHAGARLQEVIVEESGQEKPTDA